MEPSEINPIPLGTSVLPGLNTRDRLINDAAVQASRIVAQLILMGVDIAEIVNLLTNIDLTTLTIELNTDQINVNLDQVEALITATNLILNTLDRNYGTVGVATLRTAAQIGNLTGQADFNAGITTAQTLRVVLPTNQTAIPITLPSIAQILTSSIVGLNGSVPAGTTSVIFKTSGAFIGDINGMTREPSMSYSFVSATGKLLPAIPYVITNGSIEIDYLT